MGDATVRTSIEYPASLVVRFKSWRCPVASSAAEDRDRSRGDGLVKMST